MKHRYIIEHDLTIERIISWMHVWKHHCEYTQLGRQHVKAYEYTISGQHKGGRVTRTTAGSPQSHSEKSNAVLKQGGELIQ